MKKWLARRRKAAEAKTVREFKKLLDTHRPVSSWNADGSARVVWVKR